MRIAHINALTQGSTGGVMLQIAEIARSRGHEVFTYAPYPFSKTYKVLPKAPKGHNYYGTWLGRRSHNLVGRIFGFDGYNLKKATKELIRQLQAHQVELVHLHNLHGYCIHLPALFSYIKKNNVKVVWTLHDCWSFTGHCTHYEVVGCNRWKSSCNQCPQIREYPQCLLDNSGRQHRSKKRWFSGVENMILVTPSHWLEQQVRQSFLGEYPVQVIYNGIDLSVFKPTDSSFRKKYHLEGKKILLGVSFNWSERKGIDVFLELAKHLDISYQIVLVGNAAGQSLPDNILSIPRTENQKELAELYSVADVFVNPTREEVLGLVNIEALACGTPVVTFRSGGSPECVDDNCGVVVEKDNLDAMMAEIIRICAHKPYCAEACVRRAVMFDKNLKYTEYLELYEKSRSYHALS